MSNIGQASPLLMSLDSPLYILPESAESSPASASLHGTEALDGRQVSQLRSDASTVNELQASLKKSSIVGKFLSILKAGYFYARAWAFSPMLDESRLAKGIEKWVKNPFSEPSLPLDHVFSPVDLNQALEIIKEPRVDKDGALISPCCIPVLVGSKKYGHWVTLVLHTNSDGQRQATLFNSKDGCSEGIKAALSETLQAQNFQPLVAIEAELQGRLRLSCAAFSAAAIDAVMTNHTNGATETVEQTLTAFANECLQRNAAEEDAWDVEWRAKMNPQNEYEADSSLESTTHLLEPNFDDLPELLPSR